LKRPAAAVAAALIVALPGCGGDTTDDHVVASVPADARAYLHLDRGSGDWESASEALGKLAALESLVLSFLADQVQVPGDGEAGVALLAGQEKPVVVERDDPLTGQSLADVPDYRALLEGLPDERFAHAYLARSATGFVRSLDPTVTSAAVGADIDGDTMRLRARVRHVGQPGPCVETTAEPLAEIADPKAAFYVEAPSIGCALRTLARRYAGVRGAMNDFARAAERGGGVSFEDDVMPLLEHRGALIASPGKVAPVLTFVLRDVDEEQALDVLSRLQPALIRLVGSEALGQAPTFGAAEVAGVTAATANLAPGLQLSYAAWDGLLVVSTALEGIAAIREEEGLTDTEGFEAVLSDTPAVISALVFLDLNQLLTLGEQAGLAEDPRYLAVRDDLQKLRAAVAVVSREEANFTTAELTFQIP
jgi:hypothetical protein